MSFWHRVKKTVLIICLGCAVQLSGSPFYDTIRNRFHPGQFKYLQAAYSGDVSFFQQLYLAAVRRNPKSLNDRWQLAVFYKNSGQSGLMVQEFAVYRKLLRQTALAEPVKLYWTGRSFMESGDNGSALKLLEQADKLGYRWKTAGYDLALCAMESGSLTKAETYMQRYLKNTGIRQHSEAWMKKYLDLYREKYPDRAVRLLRQFTVLHPTNSFAYSTLAELIADPPGKNPDPGAELLALARQYYTANKDMDIYKISQVLEWFQNAKSFDSALKFLHEIQWSLQQKGLHWYRLYAEARFLHLKGEHVLACKKLQELILYRKNYGAGPGELHTYRCMLEKTAIDGTLPGVLHDLGSSGFYRRNQDRKLLLLRLFTAVKDGSLKALRLWADILLKTASKKRNGVYFIKEFLFQCGSKLPIEISVILWNSIMQRDPGPVQWAGYSRWIAQELINNVPGTGRFQQCLSRAADAAVLADKAFQTAPNLYRILPVAALLYSYAGKTNEAKNTAVRAFYLAGESWAKDLPSSVGQVLLTGKPVMPKILQSRATNSVQKNESGK